MPSAVVDASAIVDLLIGAPQSARLFDRLFRRGELLFAPQSIDLEVIHALDRLRHRRLLREADMARFADAQARLAIERHAITPLVPRVWALRHNVSTYDAIYVALAEHLDVPLVTRDKRLAGTSGHAVRIEYID